MNPKEFPQYCIPSSSTLQSRSVLLILIIFYTILIKYVKGKRKLIMFAGAQGNMCNSYLLGESWAGNVGQII